MKFEKIYKALTWITLIGSITAFTRILQTLYKVNNFNKNGIKTSLFKNTKKSKESCNIQQNSILNLSSNNKDKNLIIIIDAFPTQILYKKLTGKESLLHSKLSKISEYSINSLSKSSSTVESLAYILADISNTKKGCTYPLFGGNFTPNFINSSPFFSSSKSICSTRDKYIIGWIKTSSLKLASELIFFNSYFENKYIYALNKKVKRCSLANTSIPNQISNWISKNNKEFKNYPLIFHDVYFHNQNGTNKLQLYEKIDKEYAITIQDLISRIKKKKLLDNILVLSDHGPRVNKNKIKLDALSEEQNRRGFFIYYIPVENLNKSYINSIKKFELN